MHGGGLRAGGGGQRLLRDRLHFVDGVCCEVEVDEVHGAGESKNLGEKVAVAAHETMTKRNAAEAWRRLRFFISTRRRAGGAGGPLLAGAQSCVPRSEGGGERLLE